MKDVRFYLEFDSATKKRRGQHSGNVFALFVGYEPQMDQYALGKWVQAGVGAVMFHPNSPVCGCSTSLERLRVECKRISEARAREIHPELFSYLDN